MLLIRDPVFLEHDPGPGHPEHPGRLAAIHEDLDARPIAGLTELGPEAAAEADLLRVHTPEHIALVRATDGELHRRLDPDTATSPGSYRAAVRAAGAAVQATRAVTSGERSGAMCLIRPPGHHAEADRAMGFCLFNNVAVAAAWAVAELGCKRVLVVDPDVHHGNGTQNCFYDRADVLYVSSHQWPLYPGSGWVSETGAGRGAGYTVNLPLPAGTRDADLLFAYRDVVDPIVRSFEPDLVLISAGFDTWHGDPVGGMRVTEAGYRALCALFQAWAADYCPGRLTYLLEGGYASGGLIAGVRSALEVGTGALPRDEAAAAVGDEAPHPAVERIVGAARDALEGSWAALRD